MMKTRKSILMTLSLIAALLISIALLLLLPSPKLSTQVSAEESPDNDVVTVESPGGTLKITGQTTAYCGETLTYTLEYTTDPSQTFLIPETNHEKATIGIPTQGDHCYYYPIIIADDALPGMTFTFTVSNMINEDSVSINVSLQILYATGIEELSFAVNNIPLSNEVPTVRPGDVVSVSVEKYIVSDEIYDGSKLTFTQFSLSITAGSEYAELNENYTEITIKDGSAINTDNPSIQVEVTVTQNWAPEDYVNLRETIVMPIYVPVETFEVEGTTGFVDRGSEITYEVSYNEGIYGNENSNNIASEKGFNHTLTDEAGVPIQDPQYFQISWNGSDIGNSYSFTVNIAENAPYGNVLNLNLVSKADPAKLQTLQLSVKELESAYTVEYSKDYMGTTNPGNGIQLVESGNKTQLRASYSADILLRGATTNTLYSAKALLEKGVTVDFNSNEQTSFSVNINGKMTMLADVPAYTNGSRTFFEYTIDISDGSKSYSQMEKKVEAYVPAQEKVVQTLQLQNPDDETEYVTSAQNYMLETSYNIIANLGGDYTVRPIDLNYSISSSYFSITKDTDNNKVILTCNSPSSVGTNSYTITVNSAGNSNYLYNNQNLYGTWSKTLTVYRGFITSLSQLQSIKNRSSKSYRLQNSIFFNSNDTWTPFTFSGTLDGNGYNIYNITFKSIESSNLGLVSVNNGTIKNLIISNMNYSNYENSTLKNINFGAIAGTNIGLIENCTVGYQQYYSEVHISELRSCNLGSICGLNSSTGRIKNCNVRYSYLSIGSGAVGGVVGKNEGSIDGISMHDVSLSCYNTYGETLQNSFYSSGHYGRGGGIAGWNTGTIKNAELDINIEVNSAAYFNDPSIQSQLSSSYMPELGIYCGRSNTSTFSNCSYLLVFVFTSSGINETRVGGLVGYIA